MIEFDHDIDRRFFLWSEENEQRILLVNTRENLSDQKKPDHLLLKDVCMPAPTVISDVAENHFVVASAG